MDKIIITATSQVTEADLKSARLGMRFGRLDLSSQLALLAVESPITQTVGTCAERPAAVSTIMLSAFRDFMVAHIVLR